MQPPANRIPLRSLSSYGRALVGLLVVASLPLVVVACDDQKRETSATPEPGTNEVVQPETSPPNHAGDAGDWTSTVADYLDAKYPQPIMGMVNTDTDAVVNYVARYPAEDHLVYVTDGASAHRFPHEFVMRIRFDTNADDLDERAPAWPDHVLAELAEVESRTQRLFTPGDSLENLKLDGVTLPYRHFVIYKDPHLDPLDGPGPEPLFFLQVIPLTDAQLSKFNATPEGAPSKMMREWSERDPLLLVDSAFEGSKLSKGVGLD